MKKYIVFFIVVLCIQPLFAQTGFNSRSQYEQFKKQRQQEYSSYREKANREYAEYLKLRWEDYKSNPAEPAPVPDVMPEPVVAPIAPAKPDRPAPVEKPKVVITTKPRVVSTKNIGDQVKEIVRESITYSNEESDILEINFYGDIIKIPFDIEDVPYIKTVNENGFSVIWNEFGQNTVELKDPLESYISTHRINGWATYQLVKVLSESIYSSEFTNERIALQAYLLSQMEYYAQVAMCGKDLVLLLPFKEQIYEVSYISINSSKYYIFGYGHDSKAGYKTYSKPFGDASAKLSVSLDTYMQIGETQIREFEGLSNYLGFQLSAPISMGNIALQYNYPIVDNIVYYRQCLAPEFSKAILQPLGKIIAGMSEQEAVSYLLAFVQKGFEYITDKEAFGRHKQLFIEESFLYGKNNCKDRVGVFSWLIKELLHLDVIGVRFEGNPQSNGIAHITCAVAFSNDVNGDSFTIKNKRYVMCDPTYINAGIGETMPCYANSKGEILYL